MTATKIQTLIDDLARAYNAAHEQYIDASEDSLLELFWSARCDVLETLREHALGALSAAPREWDVSEDGHGFATVTASSADEACELAREWLRENGSGYDLTEHTVYSTYRVRCDATDEDDTFDMAWEQDEPACDSEAGEHDWQAPFEILGGLKENPGVLGHGGGVIMERVCMHCGCGKTIDTWAQRPDTGEQGLTEVSYEPGKYSEQLSEYNEKRS